MNWNQIGVTVPKGLTGKLSQIIWQTAQPPLLYWRTKSFTTRWRKVTGRKIKNAGKTKTEDDSKPGDLLSCGIIRFRREGWIWDAGERNSVFLMSILLPMLWCALRVAICTWDVLKIRVKAIKRAFFCFRFYFSEKCIKALSFYQFNDHRSCLLPIFP